MSQWKYTLHIKNEWKACKEGMMNIKDLALSVIKKLQAFKIEDDFELDDIIEELQFFTTQEEQDVNEFDNIWSRLYDWADQTLDSSSWPHKKLCWVETF